MKHRIFLLHEGERLTSMFSGWLISRINQTEEMQ